jgi:hypothetical protein
MHLSKLKRAGILMAAALASLQMGSMAHAAQTIFFSTAGSAQPVANQLVDTGTGAHTGTFTPSGGANSVINVTGSNGFYVPGYVSGINATGGGDASDFLNIGGFNPTSDPIFIGLKVDAGGSPVSPGNTAAINQLINAINADNNGAFPEFGTSIASTIPVSFQGVFPGYDIMLSLPETYTNAVTPGSGSSGQFDFAFNFTNYSTDSGAFTVTDIAVVPEPASLGLLAVGALLTLPRYRRRPA